MEQGSAAAKYENSVGTVLHAAVPGQEAGCHLFKNNDGGYLNFSCHPGSDESNYLKFPSSIQSSSSLLTQPVVPGTVPSCARPKGMDHWNILPEEMRIRSAEIELSVEECSETEFMSVSNAVGEVAHPVWLINQS